MLEYPEESQQAGNQTANKNEVPPRAPLGPNRLPVFAQKDGYE